MTQPEYPTDPHLGKTVDHQPPPPASVPPRPDLLERIGRYRVEKILGEDVFSRGYSGHDVLLLLLLVGWGGYQGSRPMPPEKLVQSLVSAETASVPHRVEQVPPGIPFAERVEAILVPKGSTVKVQMHSRKAIKTISNTNEKVLRIRTVTSGPWVVVTGLESGVSRLTLTDSDGKEEKLVAVVEEK
jgi:hypothetical protein